MFIVIWERICGYDYWNEADATILSRDSYWLPNIIQDYVTKAMVFQKKVVLQRVTVRYKAIERQSHTKSVWLFICFSIMELEIGDEFSLKYNPQNIQSTYIQKMLRLFCV